MTQPPLLRPEQRERIYARRIQPDLLAGAMASPAPIAMVIGGQPGAGVPSVAALLRRELTRANGAVAHFSEERLRAYHLGWRAGSGSGADPGMLRADAIQPDIGYWLDRLVQDAQKQRLHILLEDELRDPRSMYRLCVALRKDGYVVQAVFVSTHRDESRLATMARYDLWRAHGLPARFVSAQEHDAALANLRAASGLLEDRRAADGVRIIDRHAAQRYENRLVDGAWRRSPRAQAILDAEQDRVRPPKELVQWAMRWETLVQRLAHDPAVPRDVASQALIWRNEAAARCEAAPATAQMLQWAREGAAFRVMDRFAFEREFPHHGRAVKSLGAAILEAEKYDPAEGARFVASARENIAQRIERGDMARIAAREKAQAPPTR